MALTNCRECGGHVNDSASKCMGCGAPTGSTRRAIRALLMLAVVSACGWFYLGGGWDRLAAHEVPRSEAMQRDAAGLHR